MNHFRCLLYSALLGSVLVSPAVAAAPNALQPAHLLLGDSDGAPVVYFRPVTDLSLALSQVAYDSFGQPDGYTLELGLASSPKLTVLVRRTSEPKANPKKFVAQAGEQTLAELSAANTKEELVALDPAGGMVLAAPGELTMDMTTEFAYDNFGRRQISSQTFAHAGVKWKAIFSDHTRDKFGRITGYKALLSRAE